MSYQYESMNALALKADWEGGWAELILGYGVGVEQLPPDAPAGFADKMAVFVKAWDELRPLLPDPDYHHED